MLTLGIISGACIALYLLTKNVFPADANSEPEISDKRCMAI